MKINEHDLNAIIQATTIVRLLAKNDDGKALNEYLIDQEIIVKGKWRKPELNAIKTVEDKFRKRFEQFEVARVRLPELRNQILMQMKNVENAEYAYYHSDKENKKAKYQALSDAQKKLKQLRTEYSNIAENFNMSWEEMP